MRLRERMRMCERRFEVMNAPAVSRGVNWYHEEGGVSSSDWACAGT